MNTTIPFKNRVGAPRAFADQKPPSVTATIFEVMTDETLIAEAGRRLAKAAPDARVILFGSHARGEAHRGSDLDLLVVEAHLRNRREEFVRLREALGAMGVPIDLIVVSAEHAERWGSVQGTLMHEALRDGRVLAG